MRPRGIERVELKTEEKIKNNNVATRRPSRTEEVQSSGKDHNESLSA